MNDIHVLVPPIITGIVAVSLAFWGFSRDKNKQIDRIFNLKVDKEDCIPVKQRFIKEIERLELKIEKQEMVQSQLKAGMAFLVGKQGGDPHEMGLM